MKLLKAIFAVLCVLGLTAGCASYRTCPAYAQKSQEIIYNPDFKSEPNKADRFRSL
jgi:hypothetical protein